MFSYYSQNSIQHVNTFEFLQFHFLNKFEHVRQIFIIFWILPKFQSFALVFRDTIDHFSSTAWITLDELAEEVDKVLSFIRFQLQHHPHINQADLNLLSHFQHLPVETDLLLQLLVTKISQQLIPQEQLDCLVPNGILDHPPVSLSNHLDGTIVNISNFHHDVAPMVVCMQEVMLHQHLKKCSPCQACNELVHRILVLLVVGDGLSLHKRHNEHFFGGFRIGFWETDIRVYDQRPEFFQVAFFFGEVNLVVQHLFKNILVERDGEPFGKNGQQFAHPKPYGYIFIDVLIHIWMSHLDCNFFTFINCLVDLTDGS